MHLLIFLKTFIRWFDYYHQSRPLSFTFNTHCFSIIKIKIFLYKYILNILNIKKFFTRMFNLCFLELSIDLIYWFTFFLYNFSIFTILRRLKDWTCWVFTIFTTTVNVLILWLSLFVQTFLLSIQTPCSHCLFISTGYLSTWCPQTSSPLHLWTWTMYHQTLISSHPFPRFFALLLPPNWFWPQWFLHSLFGCLELNGFRSFLTILFLTSRHKSRWLNSLFYFLLLGWLKSLWP